MGSAKECALVGTLYMRVRLRVLWKKRSKEEDMFPSFIDGNLVGKRRFDERCQCRKLSYVVYCTVCVQVYCPACQGRKCAESTVGSTQLSYAYRSVTSVYAY
jgi:hypothetical protein